MMPASFTYVHMILFFSPPALVNENRDKAAIRISPATPYITPHTKYPHRNMKPTTIQPAEIKYIEQLKVGVAVAPDGGARKALEEDLDTVFNVIRGRNSSLLAAPPVGKALAASSPTCVVFKLQSTTSLGMLPEFSLCPGTKPTGEARAGLTPQVLTSTVHGTVYNRGSKPATAAGRMSFFGVDSALYGTPRNTEPVFDTLDAVMKHIAARR